MDEWDVEFSSHELPEALLGADIEIRNNLERIQNLPNEPSIKEWKDDEAPPGLNPRR
jgi:hypothetical protein